MNATDIGLFRAVNGASPSLAPVMITLSQAHGLWAVRIALLAFVIAMFRLGPRHRASIALALVSFVVANEVCDVLKASFASLRPCADLREVVEYIGCGSPRGTASSHAANMAALASVCWLRHGWKMGLPWALIALGVGVSRVYVSAHYPSQVLIGWTVGAATAASFVWGWSRYEARRAVSNADEPDREPG